ncbi:hypothetical protein V9T40_010558 [Parthenolecanium corni]|uniref:Uncharacterized protein n=1 Tax=Parthenolecanium corni TaxID=536013 RepID=A0AAN9TGY2_9HEMI
MCERRARDFRLATPSGRGCRPLPGNPQPQPATRIAPTDVDENAPKLHLITVNLQLARHSSKPEIPVSYDDEDESTTNTQHKQAMPANGNGSGSAEKPRGSQSQTTAGMSDEREDARRR